jgi:hypothetical protein
MSIKFSCCLFDSRASLTLFFWIASTVLGIQLVSVAHTIHCTKAGRLLTCPNHLTNIGHRSHNSPIGVRSGAYEDPSGCLIAVGARPLLLEVYGEGMWPLLASGHLNIVIATFNHIFVDNHPPVYLVNRYFWVLGNAEPLVIAVSHRQVRVEMI